MVKPIGADKERKARNLDEALGAVITQARLQRGWSQQKLAEIAGYDESYLRQLERGKKSATLRTLSDLAAAFSMSTSRLIRLSEKKIQRASLDAANKQRSS